MTHAALVAWAVSIMITQQPPAITPWADTYESSAEAFVTVAEEAPLHDPAQDGIRRTLSDFLSVAWFESRYDQKAKGDCKNKDPDGKCSKTNPQYQSFCAFQVGKSNFAYLKTTEEDLLGSIMVCTLAARKMMRESLRVCRGRPQDEWLGHYASGGNTCAGLKESRHRVNLSTWFFTHTPF